MREETTLRYFEGTCESKRGGRARAVGGAPRAESHAPTPYPAPQPPTPRSGRRGRQPAEARGDWASAAAALVAALVAGALVARAKVGELHAPALRAPTADSPAPPHQARRFRLLATCCRRPRGRAAGAAGAWAGCSAPASASDSSVPVRRQQWAPPPPARTPFPSKDSQPPPASPFFVELFVHNKPFFPTVTICGLKQTAKRSRLRGALGRYSPKIVPAFSVHTSSTPPPKNRRYRQPTFLLGRYHGR